MLHLLIMADIMIKIRTCIEFDNKLITPRFLSHNFTSYVITWTHYGTDHAICQLQDKVCHRPKAAPLNPSAAKLCLP
jgi:hypothetical protein